MLKHAFAFAVGVAILSCAPSRAHNPGSPPPPGFWLFREPARFLDPERERYWLAVGELFSDSDGVPGGCFRMISLVDGKPEEMVYANCSGETDELPAQLVHLAAVESVAARMRAPGEVPGEAVKIRRTEASISTEDARLLQRVWMKMLEASEVEKGGRIRERPTDYFFSAFRVGVMQGCVGAVAKNPPDGSPAATLVGLGELLARIADSDVNRKENVIALRNRALELLDRLELQKK
jgi:hypothetical protein